METRSWLVRNGSDRERMLDMDRRRAPVRLRTFAVLALACSLGPWVGWWTIAPLLGAAGLFRQLLLLPELHLSGQPGLLEEQSGYPEEVAVSIPGPLTEQLAELAGESGLWLVPGTVFERSPTGEIHNTALAFSPAGELVARYRKVFPWQPHEECVPGDTFVTFDIPGLARVGLAICYDGNFPEAFRQLAWMGAEVVLQPTLTTTSDRDAELVLARANAIVNQLYVVNLNAASPAGLGRSLVVDPEGLVRRQAGGGEELITDVLDVDAVRRVRELGTAGVSRMWEQAQRQLPELRLPSRLRGG
jgi:formamidase